MANENVEALRQKYMKDVPIGFILAIVSVFFSFIMYLINYIKQVKKLATPTHVASQHIIR